MSKKQNIPKRRGAGASASSAAPVPATVRGASAQVKASLADLRGKISDLDRRLVDILNERAELVVRVGKLKQRSGLPVYTPHREAEVVDRAIKASNGLLAPRTLEAIFRELMSGSVMLQQPMRVGYLGPPGSYSHMAAVKQFGSSMDYEDLHEIAGVFTEVRRGHVHCGLVPIENSTGGGIDETMDAFRDGKAHHGEAGVVICAEVQIEVHHNLLANCPPREVRRIHSKPEVFAQCRRWLSTQYPNAELVPTPSSSKGVEMVAKESARLFQRGRVPQSAAIGSELAGQIHGLNTLFADIEDQPDNITRFYVISRQPAQRSGDDKTSVMFHTEDKPGALVHALQAFERHGINLTHIEKRPSGRRNWTYTFFVDARGHAEDPDLAAALTDARSHCRDLIVLGSYPRSKRIL